MEQRVLGRTGRPVSVIGLGTWQLGADWGNVSDDDALAVLHAAVESGVTFLDTADVYGDGRSERVIGRFIAGNAGAGVTVATKMGRRVDQVPENYTLENFRAWTDRSRVNLGVDTLDLVQLHCPPTPGVLLRRGLRRARHAGRRGAHRGLRGQRGDVRGGARPRSRARAPPPCRSSSTRSGASRWTRCCRPRPRPGSASSPGCRWPPGCCPAGTPGTPPSRADDHRSYNRHGEAFDVGETFSGVDYAAGVRRRARVRRAGPAGRDAPRRRRCGG